MANTIQWSTIIVYEDNEEIQKLVVPTNLSEQVVKGIKQTTGHDAEIIPN